MVSLTGKQRLPNIWHLVVEYAAILFVLDAKIYWKYWGKKPRKKEIAPGFLGRWRI